MALNDHTTFKGVTTINRDNLTNNILYGTIDFLKWGFLNVGGFQNITRNPAVSGALGGDRFRLRNSDDPSYDVGQVWEGFRNDWVWESGFAHEGISPIPVSGVWVDGTFYLPDDATYSHYIDYPNGRIVFDTGVTTTKTVEASFTHRTVGITKSSEEQIQELMFDSYDIETLDAYLLAGSGTRNQLGAARLQLPVIGVEVVKALGHKPYEIGGGQWAFNNVLFHIFADNEEERNNIRDAIVNQNDKTIWIINRGTMKEDDNYPLQLDSLGSPKPSAVMYPDLVAPTGEGGFRWRKINFGNTTADDMEPIHNWLYRSTVKTTFTAVMQNI